jgi:uncharacterized membrane protein SpoIIM required for sporulation
MENPPKSHDRLLKLLLRPRQMRYFGIILVMEVGSIFIGAVLPLPRSLLGEVNTTYRSITSGVYSLDPLSYWAFLSLHNLRNALMEALPGVGVIIAAISAMTTGIVLQTFALFGARYPIENALTLAALLFIFPHSIVELSGYALSASSGTAFVVSVLKKEGSKTEAVQALVVGMAASAVLILTAAALETLANFTFLAAAFAWFPLMLSARWLWRKSKALNASQTMGHDEVKNK